jgi:hypothetical protein
MADKKINPFKHEYFLGYISQVSPQFVKIHFPSSVLLSGFTHFGEEHNGGLVGNFVVIEGDKFGFLGRITELSLPESERLSLNEKAFQNSDFHPTGKVEILLSFDLFNPFKVRRGISAYPNIGAKVFVSSGELVQEYMANFGIKENESADPVTLGYLVANPSTKVKVNVQAIFGRHCAIVGTTGGGKSYTVSKLIEALSLSDNKAILIDATGEYSSFDSLAATSSCKLGVDCHFHYKNLSVADLFIMFRPSGQVQQPILLEAINALKLAAILERNKAKFKITEDENFDRYHFTGKSGELFLDLQDGCIIKQGKKTSPFLRLCAKYSKELNDHRKSEFDITKLTRQINYECVQNYGEEWGKSVDTKMQGNASSLILRVHQALTDSNFKKIFGFDGAVSTDVISKIEEFVLNTDKHSLLRIAFEKVPFAFQIREIVANAIGAFLLDMARGGMFDYKVNSLNTPLVLLIDEAHQVINKSVKDEYFDNVKLDSFDLIAKECRKHGLFLCIATQMPRDIPHGTLSQMGTFIVHRLINPNDKEAIANACGSAGRSTLEFLPILGEGEAILTGVDFPMPVILKIDEPKYLPKSGTPRLKQRKLII